VRGDGVHVHRQVQPGIVLAEQVGQPGQAAGPPHRGVQRGGVEIPVRLACLGQLRVTDPQVTGQLRVGRRVSQHLGQVAAGRPDPQQQVLGGAPDPDLPPLITEMPLDLAADAGLRVRGQAAAQPGIEVVDRLDQADVTDLHEFLSRLRAVPVAQHARPDQALVPAHQDLTRRAARRAAHWLARDERQQLILVPAEQVRPRQWRATANGRPGHVHLRARRPG
jgi:hypothetical protein